VLQLCVGASLKLDRLINLATWCDPNDGSRYVAEAVQAMM